MSFSKYSNPFTLRPIALAIAIATATGGPLLPTSVFAQQEGAEAETPLRQTYYVPAGSLTMVLNTLAQQAGLSLSFDPGLTQGMASEGLDGQYSTAEALDEVLADTGLDARFTGADRVTLARETSQANGGETSLQTIEVLGRNITSDFADSTFAATKTETHILDVPQTVNAVTKEVIEEQNLLALNDITPFVAGMNEFSVYDDITIRGFRNSDDRRVNGLRVYNNFWTQPYIANVERVEVIKGPSAVLYGQASPGGVVNIVTKKPLAESRHEVRGDLGTFGGGDNQGLLAVDTTGPINDSGTLLYRFNASQWDHDSFRTEIFDEGYSLSPSLSWVPSEDTRLNLELNYTSRETVLDRGQPNLADASDLGAVPTNVSVTQPGDGFETQDFTASLSLDQALSDQWRLAGTIQYHSYDEELGEHRVAGSLPSGSEYNVRYGERQSEAETLSGTLYATGRFDTGNLAHELVVGLDALSQETESQEQQVDNVFVFDVLNPENVRRPVDSYSLTTPSWSPWGEDNTRTGLFIQDRVTLGDWDFLAGLRYSNFSTQPMGGEENSDNDLAPRLGTVYRYTDDLSFYGTYAEGFEPNFGYTSAQGGPFDPTTSRLFEVGAKHLAFGGDLLFTAALYHIINDDIVTWVDAGSGSDLYRQRGQEQSTGLELEAIGNITDRLSVIANYAYNNAEVTEDEVTENVGKTKEGAPHHMATLWGKYDLGNGFAVGAGAEYVGERETFEEGFTLPDYTLYNAGLFYETGGLNVSLMGKNLTDEEHWTGGYYPGRVYPGDQLKVTLSASYAF
ncbi:TonB-dependent receptor [Halomonas sp. LC1]|uniref:TonB-dependent siderophore receptor n=1 Tax=Halomonas sp. LC1 TaxID=3043733 RepID=UPI002556774E|nr:TonB-dependent receptor [Halomonas sp. LC1]MDK9687108.1 TonB-dependent receptor [Halomonas sp. LC1]